jgi:succinoglycan biosynthesis transport protein ExoP
LSGILSVVRRWWWLLALGGAVAALMGFLVEDRLPPAYESEASLLVGPVSGDRDVLEAAGQQARTYAGIARTATIVTGAAARVGLSPQSLRSKLEDVTASNITRLLTIRVRDTDPERAAAIANAVAAQLTEFATEAAGLTPREGRMRVVERATPSTNDIGPSAGLIVPLAALAGVLGALGLAVLVDSLSTTVKNERELAQLAPVAVLGSVDGTRLRALGRPFVVEADPDSEAATGYRLLAAKIELSNGNRPLRSVLVLDAHGGHSGGRLATNLAGALAEGGARVSLIDSGEKDVRELLGFSDEAAASESGVTRGRPLKVGRVMLDRFRVQGSKVTVLQLRSASEPLELERAAEVLERVGADADVIVLTTAAVDRSPNGLVWSRAAEATVLVTQRDHTKREQIPAAVETLQLAGANVIGTVLCRDRIL